ncbi:hypothetical protein PCASD_25566 [Puccinia coronata f. sp. avenae]|uniref:Uncharacterized protein n=1 Tax=Puccinia coronata f. sp. avenae TaxID=200324 RepID=A0A2N5S2B5_9BASI|nr:hypothetical protein PCASD_25566 [Puccinia coronata f. sp. avenae]
MAPTIDIEALERAAKGASPPGQTDLNRIPPGQTMPNTSSALPRATKKAPRKRNKWKQTAQDTEDDACSSNNAPPASQTAANPKAPLSIVTQASKKNKKHAQADEDNKDNPQCPIPTEDLMKLSVIELCKIAQDYSKQSMSEEDEEFFLALHQEQEKQQAIKAIERGISLSMVFALLGRRIAVKEANHWNRFLQTDQARLIFQESGLGVKDKSVMKQLSAAYALLAEEEKAALLNNPNPDDSELDTPADGEASASAD